tara:strand:- start:72 stop:347 length:276 start_codon:yes stop_codon:yes gene_type:complete
MNGIIKFNILSNYILYFNFQASIGVIVASINEINNKEFTINSGNASIGKNIPTNIPTNILLLKSNEGKNSIPNNKPIITDIYIFLSFKDLL